LENVSAKGAQYESQGQARSEAERVAPGALKVREISSSIIPLFQSFTATCAVNQGRRASRCSALAPGFHIPRLWRSYPALLALA